MPLNSGGNAGDRERETGSDLRLFRQSDSHLLQRGASATIEDGTHNSDAAGWARACDDGSEAAATIRGLVGAAASES